ncbi:MAG: UvrB/UvrC motif-containing protein, partial [Muribaculaceae bacterium]|nr:UvrB/UvrC motif-containing protein [Muribaculaceae bacterium]
VIMYADHITESMQQTIDETERRRTLQMSYNEQHNITPQAIIKARNAIIGREDSDDVAAQATMSKGKQLTAKEKRQVREKATKIQYGYEYTTDIDIAADPVVPYMTSDELERSIVKLRAQMLAAAKEMEFIEAARLRDEVIKLESRLEDLRKN